MKARARMVITGVVQGVGYRAFAERRASNLGLTGWVRNRADGSVEALVEGERDKIEELLTHCRRGPTLSQVEDVEVTWEDFRGENSYFTTTW